MKLLVIGAGSIGRRHAANAATLADEAAIFDLNPELAVQADLQTFESLDSALGWGADGIIIATPHTTHIELAHKAVESGAHALIEKPISNTIEGVEEFLDLAKEKNKSVYVVCNMRFHPAVKTLHENLPRVGQTYYARAQYGNYLPNMRPDADYKKLYCAHKDQGGGVVLDVIHEIDYLTWFFGPISSIFCDGEKCSDLDIDVEDYASIIARHENGVRTEIHMDYLQQCKRRGCEIVGSKGTLIWESEGKNPEHCRVRFYDGDNKEWKTLLEEQIDISKPYMDLMESFVENIKTGKGDNLLTGAQAAEELKTALAAYKSIESGQKVGL